MKAEKKTRRARGSDYITQAETFTMLIKLVSSTPKYSPVRDELKLAALEATAAMLVLANTNVNLAYAVLTHARRYRNDLLYRVTDNMVELSRLVKKQVLYIKELHLVKHTYNDLFFLHKKNDKRKAIRAMVQVPVTVTAYINLREVKIIHAGDTLQEIILPHAVLNEPHYQTDKMIVRETRAIQVHVGKDLYAQVPNYMQQLVTERIAIVRTLAVSNQILVQAEAEGKQYIEELLATLGYRNVRVTFGDAQKDEEVIQYKQAIDQPRPTATQTFLSYGFIPL